MAKRFASLAALAMLIFVSLVNPASAQNSPLTPDLLNKLLDLVTRKGTNQDLPAEIANPLGLSASGQNWASRQIAIRNHENLYGFGVSRGSEQDLVITNKTPDGPRVFRTHRDGTVVTAVIYDIGTRQWTVPDRAEAQKEVDAEFAYWASAVTDTK